MAIKSKLRLSQITGSFAATGNSTKPIVTTQPKGTLASINASAVDLSGSLSHMASAIQRIHGVSSGEAFNNAAGTFYHTLKSDSTGNVDIGSTTDADKFGDIFVGDGKGLQIGAAEEHKIIDGAPGLLIDTSEVLELNSSGGAISIGNDAVAQNINVGTGAAARTITVGNTTGATALALNAGTGGIALASTGTGDITLDSDDTLLIDSDGVLELNSSAGAISIGNDAVAQNINVGTGAAARVITVGNVSGASQVVLNSGTGGIQLASTGAGDVTIDSDDTLLLDADGVLELNSSAGAINIGNDAVTPAINIGTGASARTITIGNDASTKVDVDALIIELDSGGDIILNATTKVEIPSGIDLSFDGDAGAEKISGNGDDLILTAGTAINIVAGAIDSSAQIVDFDLIDNNANALSFDASGQTDILKIDTTNSAEKVVIHALDVSNALTANGDLTVAGNLTVNGTTTTLDVTNLNIEDPFIMLGDNAQSQNANSGIVFVSGSSRSNGTRPDVVFARVANDVWGLGSVTSNSGSITTAAAGSGTAMTHDVALRASKLELEGASDYIHLDTDVKIVAAADIVLNAGGANVLPPSDSSTDLGVSGTAWRKLFVDDIDLNGEGRIDLDADADTSIRASADDVITFEVAGADEFQMAANVFSPSANDGAALGSDTLEWSDLYLADGAVIQWDAAADLVATHSNKLLTFSNSGTDSQVRVDKLSVTAATYTLSKDGANDFMFESPASYKLDAGGSGKHKFSYAGTDRGHVGLSGTRLNLSGALGQIVVGAQTGVVLEASVTGTGMLGVITASYDANMQSYSVQGGAGKGLTVQAASGNSLMVAGGNKSWLEMGVDDNTGRAHLLLSGSGNASTLIAGPKAGEFVPVNQNSSLAISGSVLTLDNGARGASGQPEFRLLGGQANQNYMGFRAPATITASRILTLPDGAGSNGQVLTTDGGNPATLTWADASLNTDNMSKKMGTLKVEVATGTVVNFATGATFDENTTALNYSNTTASDRVKLIDVFVNGQMLMSGTSAPGSAVSGGDYVMVDNAAGSGTGSSSEATIKFAFDLEVADVLQVVVRG